MGSGIVAVDIDSQFRINPVRMTASNNKENIMSDNNYNEVYVAVRIKGSHPDGDPDKSIEVVEVVKGHRLSKSYAKLLASPTFAMNIGINDVVELGPADPDFLDENPDFSSNLYDPDEMKQKAAQGLLFEAKKVITHGTYKIGVRFVTAKDEDVGMISDHFNKNNAIFEMCMPSVGTVSFNRETPFSSAVETLQAAPYVVTCAVCFDPSCFPEIGFSEDLIPKNDED